MTYEEMLDLSKKENVKTSLSAVKRIGLSYEIKGCVSKKFGCGRHRASTVKDDHRLKMTSERSEENIC